MKKQLGLDCPDLGQQSRVVGHRVGVPCRQSLLAKVVEIAVPPGEFLQADIKEHGNLFSGGSCHVH
jgi:hypothetical protein